MIKKTDKIFVAGHKGLVGSAILRKLKRSGYNNIITVRNSFLVVNNEDNRDKLKKILAFLLLLFPYLKMYH